MSAKRIGLFGLFGSGNIGNDGSLEAMLAFLRSALPDAKLVCVCSGAAKVRAGVPHPHDPHRRRARDQSDPARPGEAPARAQAAAMAPRLQGRAWPRCPDHAGDRHSGRLRRELLGHPGHPARLVPRRPPARRQGGLRLRRGGSDRSSRQPPAHEDGGAPGPLPVLSRHDVQGLHGEHRLRHPQRPGLPGHRLQAAAAGLHLGCRRRVAVADRRSRGDDLLRVARRPGGRRCHLRRLPAQDHAASRSGFSTAGTACASSWARTPTRRPSTTC